MIVTLNGFAINDNLSGVFLDTQIDGLDLPDIRTSGGNYSGRSGGYVGAQFFGTRSIGLQGKVEGDSVGNLESTRQDFMAALVSQPADDGTFDVTMGIVTNGGSAYIVYAKLIDFEMPIPSTLFNAPYNLSLEAPDPIIYDNATGTALTANISVLASGGYTYPVVFPVIYAAGASPTTVTNSGTQPVYPTITLTGIGTNPILTNRTTGSLLGLTLTTGVSDVILIDMANRTITLNGGSIFSEQSAGSSFWGLQPGGNDIALTTSSGTDTVTGVLSYRSGYLGI